MPNFNDAEWQPETVARYAAAAALRARAPGPDTWTVYRNDQRDKAPDGPDAQSEPGAWEPPDADEQPADAEQAQQPEPEAASAQTASAGTDRQRRERFVRTSAIKAAVKGRETEVLHALGIMWHNGGPTHVLCPFHDDHDPSWRWDDAKGCCFCTCDISGKDIFTIVERRKGIDFDEAKLWIAEQLGLSDLIVDPNADRGVTVQELADVKKLPAEFLRAKGCRDLPKSGKYHNRAAMVIPYANRQGRRLWARIRVKLSGKNKDRWRKGDVDKHGPVPLYGADSAQFLPQTGYVVLVEGETDSLTCWYNGVPALGLPGAGTWNEDVHSPLLEGVAVIFVVIERDTGGESVLRWLAQSSIRDRVRLLYMPEGVKDPSELWCRNPDKAAFTADLRACMDAAEQWREEEHAPPRSGPAQGAARSRDRDDPAPSLVTLEIGSDVEIAKCVAAALAAKFGKIVYDDGGFYRYTGTHWAQIDEITHRLVIHAYDGARYWTPADTECVVQLSKSRINSVINEQRVISARPGMFADIKPGINCASGFITFDNEGNPTQVPHHRDHGQRHILPGHWEPGAVKELPEKSLLHRLLYGVFKGDTDEKLKRRLLSQIAGCAALGYSTRLGRPKCVIFWGQYAENGKSQWLDVYRGLLPASAIASIPATKLGDQSYLVGLAGKLLNATDELRGTGAITSETFKACVTGEIVAARDLYHSAIEFRPRALQLHATNVLPNFEGGFDRGVLRRLLVLVFNRVIPPEERIVDLGKRIAAEEPDLLLAFAVWGASDLIRSGNFIIPPSSQDALTKWSGAADPVLAWARDCIEPDTVPLPGTKVFGFKSGYVHGLFRQWALAAGYRPEMIPAVNGFVQRLQAAVPSVQTRHTRGGNVLVGLKIIATDYDSTAASTEA